LGASTTLVYTGSGEFELNLDVQETGYTTKNAESTILPTTQSLKPRARSIGSKKSKLITYAAGV
jgi:hypothetical protein